MRLFRLLFLLVSTGFLFSPAVKACTEPGAASIRKQEPRSRESCHLSDNDRLAITACVEQTAGSLFKHSRAAASLPAEEISSQFLSAPGISISCDGFPASSFRRHLLLCVMRC